MKYERKKNSTNIWWHFSVLWGLEFERNFNHKAKRTKIEIYDLPRSKSSDKPSRHYVQSNVYTVSVQVNWKQTILTKTETQL